MLRHQWRAAHERLNSVIPEVCTCGWPYSSVWYRWVTSMSACEYTHGSGTFLNDFYTIFDSIYVITRYTKLRDPLVTPIWFAAVFPLRNGWQTRRLRSLPWLLESWNRLRHSGIRHRPNDILNFASVLHTGIHLLLWFSTLIWIIFYVLFIY